MSVRVEHLSKSYVRDDEVVVALDDVAFEAAAGELLVVVGPSGSGKTTLLRSIAGLEKPDAGRVEVKGRDITDVAAGRRRLAMVFQDDTLFPHLSVRDNIAFGLRARRTPEAEAARRIAEAAELLGLEEILRRRPHELSGGERQRVALARALVREPDAFLMDEPLSALDAELRSRMRGEIKALQRRLNTTTVYVTHDQTEALTIGDRVAVLRAGAIQQIASPTELYDRPANAFVARFVGNPPMNLFPSDLYGAARDGRVVGVRPEHLRLVAPAKGRFSGRVAAIENLGHEAVVHVEAGHYRLSVRSLPAEVPPEGAEVGLAFDEAAVHLFEDFDGPAASSDR